MSQSGDITIQIHAKDQEKFLDAALESGMGPPDIEDHFEDMVQLEWWDKLRVFGIGEAGEPFGKVPKGFKLWGFFDSIDDYPGQTFATLGDEMVGIPSCLDIHAGVLPVVRVMRNNKANEDDAKIAFEYWRVRDLVQGTWGVKE